MLIDLKLKIIICFILLAGLFSWHKYEVHKAVNNERERVEQISSREKIRLMENASMASLDLQTKIDNLEKEKNAKIQSLNARINTLTDSLRDRPERPSSDSVSNNTANPESPKGATGSGLYREDAKFLTWYAASTERLKIHLQQCYADYEAVYNAFEEFKKQK